MLPGESMGEGLENFFTNILNRNGRGLRPDVQFPIPTFGAGRSQIADLSGDYDSYYGGLRYSQQYHEYTLTSPAQPSPPSPSQVQNKSKWEALSQSLRNNWNLFSQRGTDVCVPSLPFYHQNASQPSFFSFEGMDTSRGTGTFIPNLVY